MRRHWWRIISLAALVLLGAGGCVSSQQEARKQATAHWQQIRTDVTLQMAQQQLEKGQAERARDSLQEVLRANPNDAHAHLLLARVLFELRDLGGAQAALSGARRLAPELAEVDYWQGVMAQAGGQATEALAAYQAASNKAQDSAEYLCALLEAKLAAGQAEQAIALATGRFKDFPGDVRLRLLAAEAAAQQGDLLLAETMYEQAIDLEPSNDNAKEALAQVLCLSGQYERAGKLLEGLQGRADRKDVRAMLAACHLACGRYAKAEQLYEACLADDPEQVSIRLRLSETRLLAGHASRARQDLEALVQRRDGEAKAWELLGHALALEGEFGRARQAYRRAGECGGKAEELQEYVSAIDRRSDLTQQSDSPSDHSRTVKHTGPGGGARDTAGAARRSNDGREDRGIQELNVNAHAVTRIDNASGH